MQDEGKRDFDAAAAHWDEEPRRLKLARDVVAAVRREIPLTTEMVALDYGCGTGLVTLGLHPFVRHITGADSSPGMLEVLSRKVTAGSVRNVDTRLLDLEQQAQFDQRYDLIVSSMTMHHVHDTVSLVARLVLLLKPGGWLAIADLEAEDGSFHGDPTGVAHHGFQAGYFSLLFSDHFLADIRVVTAAVMEKTDSGGTERPYPVLLWLARKTPLFPLPPGDTR